MSFVFSSLYSSLIDQTRTISILGTLSLFRYPAPFTAAFFLLHLRALEGGSGLLEKPLYRHL
jgi:hypothetical protein